ncbi:hypothetical protein [Bacillus sp. PK3_68]|uniref:hypothetical protein n=1 Tax=Bacillus sp. PK3_68 TaxID=2027408 RepID=UPI000E73E1D3|nr:hypothetical protein [Bacillus sp. PK3_68]RJS50129.1 hypothetical protein CJ483_22830 [Bacillus sp. PK3_68]
MKNHKKWQKISPVLLATAIGISGIAIPADDLSHVQAQEAVNTIAPANAEQIATSFITAITNEKWDEAYALLNENLKKHMTQQELSYIWQAKTSVFGKIGKQVSVKKVRNAVHTNIVMTYEGGFPLWK